MRRLWSLLASLQATAWLLVALLLLLLLNVAVPQAAVLGEDALRRLAGGSPWKTFFLFTLGLGHLSTSPLFLGALGLFFLNLLAVLADRTGPTLRQVRMRSVPEDLLLRQTGSPGARAVHLPAKWTPADAQRLLRGHGFRAFRVGDSGVWGVKNRTAPLGFLVFHASFLLLCAGGALLFYTRSVGTVRLVEGQVFEGQFGRTVRRAPLPAAPPPPFEVREVTAEFSAGEPTDLRASLRFLFPGGAREATARVNHPAVFGSTVVLVEEAGVAPELWLQDGQGYTLDRVSVAANTRGDTPTEIPLEGGQLAATLQPLWPREGFPDRAQLVDLPLRLAVREGGVLRYEGPLRPGCSVPVGARRLQLVRHRVWAGFRVVTERGGGVLILGFLLGVAGLLWRMLAYRREVFLSWGDGVLKVAGRGEFFPGRVRDELESIVRMAAAWRGPGEEAP